MDYLCICFMLLLFIPGNCIFKNVFLLFQLRSSGLNRVLTCNILTVGVSVLQVAHVGGQGDGGNEGCVPGFQVKKYQVMYRGPFQKGQRLLQGQ